MFALFKILQPAYCYPSFNLNATIRVLYSLIFAILLVRKRPRRRMTGYDVLLNQQYRCTVL